MKKLTSIIIVLSISIHTIFADGDKELRWPKEIEKKNATVTLYQPQYDSFKNNLLEGRMALSVKPKNEDLVFGALWFKARLDTDLDNRTAIIEDIAIERIHFPGVGDTSKIEQLSEFLVQEIESWDVVMSLDRLLASLSEVEI